jgi:hypothetical protein
MGAVGNQAMQRQLIVRIFNDNVVAWIKEHPLDNGERLLCAADHHNIRGLTNDSAMPA